MSEPLAETTHGHETTDASVRGIFWFIVWFIIVGIVLHFAIWGILLVYKQLIPGQDYPTVMNQPVPAEPRLQPSLDHETLPFQDVLILNQDATEQLNSYGWSNHQANLAHIPIARAEQMLVKNGIPTTLPALNVPEAQSPAEPRPLQPEGAQP